MIRNDHRNVFIAYNVLLQKQIKMTLGREPVLLLPNSLYVKQLISNNDHKDSNFAKKQPENNLKSILYYNPRAVNTYSTLENVWLISLLNFFAGEKKDFGKFRFVKHDNGISPDMLEWLNDELPGEGGRLEGTLNHFHGVKDYFKYEDLPKLYAGNYVVFFDLKCVC